MTHFSYSNVSFKHIETLLTYNIFNSEECTIIFNNKYTIYTPLIYACYISKSITQTILNECTAREFRFSIPEKYKQTDSFYERIYKMFHLEEVSFEIDEIPLLFEISKVLQAEELSKLIISMDEERHRLVPKPKEILAALIAKYTAGMSYDEYSFELSLAAKHFIVFLEDEHFIEFCNNSFYIPLIEQIIVHPNLSLFDENSLLRFLIKLCEKNPMYEYFFQYVYLEYCSPNAIQDYVKFLDANMFNTTSLKATLKCFNRKLIQNSDSSTAKFMKNRHMSFFIDDGSLVPVSTSFKSGLLRNAYVSKLLQLETSSRSSRELPNILNDNDILFFMSDNEPESWISGKLLEGSAVSISYYLIRSRDSNDGHFPQSWKLEGKKTSDTKWTLLDKHINEPFSKLQTKAFQVSNNEYFNEIRLTQIGQNTSNNYYFDINSFDVYGKFYNPKENVQNN